MLTRSSEALIVIAVVIMSVAGLVSATTACSDGVDVDGKCVPMSIIQATFTGYVNGGPPPTSQLRQDLITAQTQLAQELANRRACEGLLGPLQAKQHSELLQEQQRLLDATNQQAAPDGQVWDPQQRRYVAKPATSTPNVGKPAGSK